MKYSLRALSLFIAIASLNFTRIVLADAYSEGIDAYEKGLYPLAHQKWQESIDETNDLNALFNLGILYSNDLSGQQDLETAANLFRQAADGGLAAAQHNLALMYYQGQGISKNAERAQIWWERAANQEHPQAQFNLAAMLWNGDGVDKDQTAALKWFRKASTNGNTQATVFLDKVFEQLTFNVNAPETDTTGTGEQEQTLESTNTASADPELALKKQQAHSLFKQGKAAFDNGNYPNAYKHWQTAADLDNRGAQYYLGQLYTNGLGVDKSSERAIHWYQLAAKNGQAQAQYELARIHLEGLQNQDINKSLGLFWMQSAADNQDLRAKDYLQQSR